MTNAPKFYGSGCHWGITSTGITGFGKMQFTGTSQNSEADTETAKNGDGYDTIEVTYNHRQTANLDFWFSSSIVNGALEIAQADYPQPGDTVVITDTIDTDMSGNWIAGNTSITRGTIAKGSVSLHRFAKMP